MRIRSIGRGNIGIVALSLVIVGLSAVGYGLSASSALAQQTCPAGQTYCPSGSFVGQCRANSATCTGGTYTACGGCACPSGQVVCGTACQAPRQCPDANRATANQCAASNAESCGSCVIGYALNNATGLCEEVVTLVVTPSVAQAGNSDRSAVNVVQGGAGLLLNLQTQSGGDGTTRKNVLTVDKTGVQIGFHPDPAKLGLDLSAAGGQNLLFGIARAVGMDPALDALLLLQTIGQDGSITDRIRVTRDGNLTASGNVRGAQLCIGGSCRDSWSAVTASSVLLQNATPGTTQSGHFNVSGTGQVGSLVVNGGITAGGSVGIIGANGKIPALSSTYLSDLSGANLTGLNASNLASGTVPDARLPSGLLQNPIDGGASNVGPWLTIQGGASTLGNIALRLYDAGTADGNGNILEFAHNGGSGPVLGSKLRSMNVGANAASGTRLILETTSNNIGTLNTNQLVLDRSGNVGVGIADPTVKLQVAGALTASGSITTSGDVTSQGVTTSGSVTIGNDLTVNDDVIALGNVAVTGDVDAKNSFECVNVGSELRCNLREFWRTADRTSGYVESWRDSRTCTSVCTAAGLKACSDIQFNYECPNGALLNASWSDDDPNEFGVGGRTCASSEPYRATVSGVSCAGQFGTEYKRYRCRCQS